MAKTPEEKEQTRLKKEAEKNSKFVSKEEFDVLKEDMGKNFSQILDLLQKPATTQAEATKIVAETKKVDEAASDVADMNPRYDAKAREILGERIERTYVTYPKGGGTLFTIVIKNQFSNSPKDYLERMKEDRRTVNIEREEFRGEDGVEKWAKLILANINRPLR